jgi:hypothetical protein
MADQNSVSKNVLGRAFFGKAMPKSQALTEEELHEESIVRALSGSRQLRVDLKMWQDRATTSETELAAKTQQFHDQIRDLRGDMEATIVGLRQENEMLRTSLKDVTHRMENFQQWGLQLVTKSNDLEMFFISELGRIADHANTHANAMISMVNGSGAAVKKFLDDLNKKRDAAEFAPKIGPKKEEEDEKQMAELAAQLGVEHQPAAPPIPEFLTKPKE